MKHKAETFLAITLLLAASAAVGLIYQSRIIEGLHETNQRREASLTTLRTQVASLQQRIADTQLASDLPTVSSEDPKPSEPDDAEAIATAAHNYCIGAVGFTKNCGSAIEAKVGNHARVRVDSDGASKTLAISKSGKGYWRVAFVSDDAYFCAGSDSPGIVALCQ